MPSPSSLISVPQLLDLREQFEMGDGLFREITGIEVSVLFGYRRGKLKERPTLTETASARVKRCKELLHLATELTGSEEKAVDWIYADSPTFGGRSPIDLTVSEAAVEVVRAYVAKLRTAVAAQTRVAKELKPSVFSASNEAPAPANLETIAQIPISKSAVQTASAVKLTIDSTVSRENASPAATKPSKEKATPKHLPSPPTGVARDARVFRLKEPLANIRASRPELTL